jgi:hypothetical protein
MTICGRCGSKYAIKSGNLIVCHSCGTTSESTGLEQLAEKVLKGVVMGSRKSRIERLAGQILAGTIGTQSDLKHMLEFHQEEDAFERATWLADRFVDWFDGLDSREAAKKEE